MNEKIFDHIVELFKSSKDKYGRSLRMNSFLIQQNDKTYIHHFRNPNQKSDIRSLSKTVMTIALGIVLKQSETGKLPSLSEETFIYPLIKDVIHLKNKQNLAKLKKVKIKHLLTHTIGYEDVLLMRDDIHHMDPFEYVNYTVNYPIIHEPGELYLYSNAGFYLLSVVLQEFLQEDLISFLDRELFAPLQITDYKWERYGHYLAGATRLWLHPEDLLTFGELLLNKGYIGTKQLIRENWIRKMLTISHTTPEVDTRRAMFRRYAYGYGIWLPKNNFYFGHGTDGQILTVIPEKKTVIITLAEQKDLKPIENIIDYLIKKII